MKLSAVEMALMSRLLEEALPLDVAARRAWLAHLPEAHQPLAAALRAALLPEASDLAGLDAVSSLPRLAPEPAEPASELRPGMRVGPYELLRPLGAGGMAEVWLARRADGVFQREVALKLPRQMLQLEALPQRFARECEILASLEHALIARLYDAGRIQSGRPYIAMEYVHGELIASWCDRQRLGVRARVKLFLQILEAVEFAHGKGIIHRDLKPSNILVTDTGQVRLLDFGIAKLLADETGPQLTGLYGRALTPDYASPELLRGDPLDARSDIYSLGVLLYELLAGVRPYRLQTSAAMGLLAQAAMSVEPVRPSDRIEVTAAEQRSTSGRDLQHALRGDLDAITLKALARDPGQRYPSAAAMAGDLQRYLDGKTVQAMPPRLFDRLHKFARRNRAVLGAITTAAAVILAAVAVTLYRAPMPRAPTAASIAVLPLTDESGQANQQYFSDGISEDLITALSQFSGLKVIGRTSAFQFRDSKEDSRSIGAKLGVAHLLEGSVRREGDMVRVSAELIDTADGSTQWSERYDRPYKDLFELQDEITRAVVGALRTKLLPGEYAAAQSDRPPGGSLEAYNALLQGRFYAVRNTEADLRKAVESYTQAIALDSRYALAWTWLSQAWTILGGRFLGGVPRQEAYAQSRSAIDRALALSPDLAAAHVARGYLLDGDLDWRGADSEFRRAVALAPNDGEAKFFLARQLATFGDVEGAIELTRQALASEPLQAEWYSWMAQYLVGLGRLDEAERAIRQAIELRPAAAVQFCRLSIIEIKRNNAPAALAAAQQEPPGPWHDTALGLAHQIGGDRSAADAALRNLIENDAGSSAYQIAEVYALRNDATQTFKWLEAALGNRDSGLLYLLFDPFILRYKNDPRFAAFCRKVGLPAPAEATGHR